MGNSSFFFGDATETAREVFPEVRELGLQVSQPLGPLGGHYQERRDAPYTLARGRSDAWEVSTSTYPGTGG